MADYAPPDSIDSLLLSRGTLVPKADTTGNLKSRFPSYATAPALIILKAGKTYYPVHEGLLDEHCEGWRTELNHQPGSQPHNTCPNCPHTLSDSWLVTSIFITWLHTPDLSWLFETDALDCDNLVDRHEDSDSLIIMGAHGSETSSLSCDVAIALYDIGFNLDAKQLVDQALSFLFNYFKPEGMLPTLQHLERAFSVKPRHETNLQEPFETNLQDFFIDLYYKRYNWVRFATEKFPEGFLKRFEERRRVHEEVRGGREDVLKLRDYHEVDEEHECYCECQFEGDGDGVGEFVVE
ncbi:hypothetical protein BU23DRAFT_631290 [Bimuria novae-zelandiae CBS 107.79]|uniref:Uncharacterized protein n=1 Tax=Bimuria novae-zelandiae CBS 107.79 TaxID=1447943 RepID=A0A6A5VFP6_9PLEO|nr:hypothetical protein BU23DRAFT_631290 [Bimuria novae-zelandiae CBS 107.79]